MLEALRVAAGVPAWGRELSEEFNPWEAGLDAAVSLSKGCYVGQEIVARIHTYKKLQRRLTGLEVEKAPKLRPWAPPCCTSGAGGDDHQRRHLPSQHETSGSGLSYRFPCRASPKLWRSPKASRHATPASSLSPFLNPAN
jgi:folate-binding protein YgfZ